MSTRPSMPVKGLAISAVALGAALTLVVPMGANAAAPVSQAEGRFLTATLAGNPITDIANLAGAKATDTGAGTQTSDIPLDATLLNTINVGTPPISLLGPNSIVQLGALAQYAQARDDGSSVAFSGAVSSANSLIGLGTVTAGPAFGNPGAGNSASIGVGDPTADALSLNVTVGALAASAQEAVDGTQTGGYDVAGLGVVVGGSALNTVLTPTLSTTIGGLITTLDGLLGTTITNPIANGTVTISLADLLAAAGVASLNDLPAGTDLLQYVPAAVVSVLTNLLTSLTTASTNPLAATVLGLLTPVIASLNGLLTGLATTLNPLVAALAQLTVNNQTHNADGSFTETALKLGLGPVSPTQLATVSLANATVGPNTAPAAVTPPGTTPAATLAETGMTLPVGGVLAGAGVLAAAGVALTRVAAWRRRGSHRSAR
jgi:hypothetical protein